MADEQTNQTSQEQTQTPPPAESTPTQASSQEAAKPKSGGFLSKLLGKLTGNK